jgi:hypothetical protein
MHPNFTGVWELVHRESKFSFLPPPVSRVDTVAHADPQLKIRTRQLDANGEIIVDRDLITGGESKTIHILNRPRIIRGYWEEAALVIETSSQVSGNSRRIEDRWTLDRAGDWITIARLHEQPGGPVHQRLRQRRIEMLAPQK